MLIITPDDLGNVVRDRRRDRGMTQSELAAAVGMSRQWIVRFENGNAGTATVEHVLRLTEALELDLDLAAS